MIHDVSFAQETLDSFLEVCNKMGFKRAANVGRRTGGSADRNNLSAYEYIRTARFLNDMHAYESVKYLGTKLGIWKYILVHYVLQLQKGDFLDIQDDWQKPIHNKPIGKFFSIALTSENSIIIDNDKYIVPKYSAIEFSPTKIHEIKPVKQKNTWMVFMVPQSVNMGDVINNSIQHYKLI
jgi:hypothetical protein